MKADTNSILIYFGALTLTLIFLQLCTKNKSKNGFKNFFKMVIAALPLSLLAGLRAPSVGTDSYNYMMIFHSIYNGSFADCILHSNVESGFAILVKVISTLFGKDDSIIFFALEFISLMIFIYTLLKMKDSLNPCLAFFLYFLTFYHATLNIVRQGLAISLIAFMIVNLIEKKYFKAIVILLISISMHTSASVAALFILAAFLLKKYEYLSIKRITYFFALILLFVYFYLRWNYIIVNSTMFSSYRRYVSGGYNIGIGVFVTGFAYFVFPILLCKKIIFSEYKTEALFYMSLMFMPIAFLGYFAEYAARLNLFPRTAIILFIPHLIHKMKNQTNRKFMLCFYICWFLIGYFNDFLIGNQTDAYPYLFNI